MPNFFLSYKRVKVAAADLVVRIWAGAPRSGPRSAGFSNEIAAGTESKMLRAQGRGVTGAIGR
jgi:hypothetical protein